MHSFPSPSMNRVRDDEQWPLFDPRDVPELQDRYGDDFDAAFLRLESTDRALRTVPARKVWDRIIQAQIESGMPFMLFHDAMNST